MRMKAVVGLIRHLESTPIRAATKRHEQNP